MTSTGGPPLTRKSLMTNAVPYFRGFCLCTYKREIIALVGDLLQLSAVSVMQIVCNVVFMKSQNPHNVGTLCRTKSNFVCIKINLKASAKDFQCVTSPWNNFLKLSCLNLYGRQKSLWLCGFWTQNKLFIVTLTKSA